VVLGGLGASIDGISGYLAQHKASLSFPLNDAYEMHENMMSRGVLHKNIKG